MTNSYSRWITWLPLMASVCFCTRASAQVAVSAPTTASIIQGISITNTSNLHFGALAPGLSGGNVTVSTSGSRTSTGSITLLTGSGFPVAAAQFALLGQPNATYTITLPTTATLTLQGGSTTLLVSSFVSNPASSGSLNSSGSGTILIGGTVAVFASQTQGTYSGTFSITLTYQ